MNRTYASSSQAGFETLKKSAETRKQKPSSGVKKDTEKRSFLRKIWGVPCHFRSEAAQKTNGFLCYKVATWVIVVYTEVGVVTNMENGRSQQFPEEIVGTTELDPNFEKYS